ncbi:FMN-binding protein [Aeromicrobium sp. S22]|uniref:FMN-binding protein n=1 Tax=Aeromicrobium sp. S22 TaxID=2662029 RepID=UPI00129EF34C|nr:FMN-binding protein [Aeromicrobium sp. S22]MRK00273.1 FMN-binding protein [Aeromicrobium sp. S22]
MKLPAHKKMLSAAAAASVLLITAACGSSESDGAASPKTSSSAAPGDAATTDAADSSPGSYADGDYSAEGSYTNPGGESTVKVDLTVADGKISDVTVTPEADDLTSKQYQNKFAGGVADQVVGKSLDDLSVSKVAGSSLTSQGFNQAIETIKGEARA